MNPVESMRADWNRRAKEDANFYVAFEKRGQDREDFFATAADVVRELEAQLPRLARAGRLRALEIGCGPGRLLRPMSRHFAEIHGVDISEEMIARARMNVADVPHAEAHVASGSDLREFAGGSFDFVYSYAVFQHIPSAEVVWSYLRETVRVLRGGGIAHLQLNGLLADTGEFNTWEGVRIGEDDIREFTLANGVDLLQITGVGTQYMWTTWRRRAGDVAHGDRGPTGIVRVANRAYGVPGEQPTPAIGTFAEASMLVEGLADTTEINSLRVTVDGREARVRLIGPRRNGLHQVDFDLPEGVRTGLVPVAIGDARAWMRVVPAGPEAPRMIAINDAMDFSAYDRVASGMMKITIEGMRKGDEFRALVDGVPAKADEPFETNARRGRFEVNFRLPEGTTRGGHLLEVSAGRHRVTRMGIEVL